MTVAESKAQLPQSVKVNATLFSYYILCKRKAWLFIHNITMEKTSPLVEIGKLISQYSYTNQKHEINIDNTIVIDWIDHTNKIIHEVKKSKKVEEAHIWQVKYYLWYLEQKGLKGYTAIINYPMQRKITKVELEKRDRTIIPAIIKELQTLSTQTKPPEPVRLPICSNCAYFELCWI